MSQYLSIHFLSRTSLQWVLLILIVVFNAGCSGSSDRPDLGKVEGKITLDGQPVSAAMVSFRPTAKGRSSTALSSDDGSYRIRYDEEYGAILGEHSVRISTYRGPNGDFPGVAEIIPRKYNTETELKVTVEGGRQVIDFLLEDVPDEKKPKPRKLRNPGYGD